MSKKSSILNSLIDADDLCLIVIDAQKVFFDKLAEEEVEPLYLTNGMDCRCRSEIRDS